MPPEDPELGTSIISKASRALAVLETHNQLSASQLATELGEPVSSVYRLIRNLEQVEWIERADRRGQYRLGADVARLGQSVADSLDIRALALPILRAMREQSQETSYLCVRRDSVAVCIERIDGAQVQAVELPLGGSIALHRSAAARAILAFESPSRRLAYLDAISSGGPNPFLPGDRQRLENDLAAIRSAGIAVSEGDVTPGVLTASAPVFDHRGVVQASVSLSALEARIADSDEGIEPLVLRSAAELTAALGGGAEDAH
ncbi:IclR family transcriptional regulator [Aeromicrobium sp.]|uniref:IclR family transcriptional regulator n=1 Tax=Aeromicrobium sp. TaxID=1871063 RepID=UPI0030C10DAA